MRKPRSQPASTPVFILAMLMFMGFAGAGVALAWWAADDILLLSRRRVMWQWFGIACAASAAFSLVYLADAWRRGSLALDTPEKRARNETHKKVGQGLIGAAAGAGPVMYWVAGPEFIMIVGGLMSGLMTYLLVLGPFLRFTKKGRAIAARNAPYL